MNALFIRVPPAYYGQSELSALAIALSIPLLELEKASEV